jgi:hypothetical protein
MMATVTGGRIVSVEAKRDKTEAPTDIKPNIAIKDVSVNKDEIVVQYTFAALYADGVGHIKVTGLLMLKEDQKAAKEIGKMMKEDKKLPDEFAEILINQINYAGMFAGANVATIVDLPAPFAKALPQLKIGSPGAAPMQAPSGKPESEKAA